MNNEKNNVKIGINDSTPKLYFPLPQNDDIVLIRQKDQDDWNKVEAKRSKLQREFFSNMSGLQKAINQKKFLERQFSMANEDQKAIINVKIEENNNAIKNFKNNITKIDNTTETEKFINLTNYAPLRSAVSKEVCFKRLEKRDFPWPVFFNQAVGKDRETGDFIADIVTNMLPETLLKLYTYADFKNIYFTLPPNTSLFWYNCDLLEKDLNQTFWKAQESDTIKSLMNNKKDVLYGRDSTKLLARALYLQAVREIFDSIDGGPNPSAWAIASWIFAREASGTVFVSCANPQEEYFSHWRLIEHPTLLNNEKVDMIVCMDIKEPGKINSIEFPNGFFVDNLSKCTFQISKASIDILVANAGDNDNAKLWAEYCLNNEFEKITYDKLFNIQLSELIDKNHILKLDYSSGNLTVFDKNPEIAVDLRGNIKQQTKIIKDIVKSEELIRMAEHDIPNLNITYPVQNRKVKQNNKKQNTQQPNKQIPDERRM